VRYPLADRGEKTLRFEEHEIALSVRHAGAFQEQIPLLLGERDSVTLQAEAATVIRAGKRVTVRFSREARAETLETGLAVGPLRVVVLVLRARDRLDYVFVMPGGP
jgi:hypothetical protein